ncbi:hypothetical protein BLNAU_3470 [Blattamonas nauphoetae]|uniref:Uncharacterized protein n=1 Tax=Blattamonas nauphoetae TaxID=2049346 RepID=A0ABQ9YD56_9EUKA|nr:hypothetical protein BLNAU_3470 [Blattamonas nauphoetae]
MEEETDSLNTSTDAFSNCSQDSPSFFDLSQEPFLNFDLKSKLSFEDKSVIYSSLVALVKAEYPLNNALEDKAAQFLKSLEPKWRDEQFANRLVADLVPSSAGSRSSFVESILTLLSSPHSIMVAATLSFLQETTTGSSLTIRCRLVESDLISNVLATVQPHTLPISGNEEIFDDLIWIIRYCLQLALPPFVRKLGITAAVDTFNHLNMIFQKVVLPSSQCVSLLISNRYVLKGDLLDSFMSLLVRFIDIGPFHRPTLEFVLTSPIVMAFSSCLSFVEDDGDLWSILITIDQSLSDWKKEGAEVTQSGKRMIQEAHLVFLVEMGCYPHSRRSKAIHDLFEQAPCPVLLLMNQTEGGHPTHSILRRMLALDLPTAHDTDAIIPKFPSKLAPESSSRPDRL